MFYLKQSRLAKSYFSQWFGWTIAKLYKMSPILFLDHWKTEFQNIWYSNVLCIPMIGIKALSV